MMVTFVSQCEKNALKKTRRVLDAFANRIGDNTWQTIITEEGLQAVKKLLRKTASKSTAVSCHWIRSRSRSQFLWVVGNKSKFNFEGVVPVNVTEKDIGEYQDNIQWKTLDVMASAASIAGLFHDFGKANILFQKKLQPNRSKKESKTYEPYRHEWVSLRLFQAFVGESADKEWLEKLARVDINQSEECFKDGVDKTEVYNHPLMGLPPFAQLVAWLVLTHHRLPLKPSWKDKVNAAPFGYIGSWFKSFDSIWNSYNCNDKDIEQYNLENWTYAKSGLPYQSEAWRYNCRKIALDTRGIISKIESTGYLFDHIFTSHLSRLSLMLADHYWSNDQRNRKEEWRSPNYAVYANTYRETRALKQQLDEHLVGVAHETKKIVTALPKFKNDLLSLPQNDFLESKVKKEFKTLFGWQDEAYKLALTLSDSTAKNGFFGINMASTGKGKTLANSKIMYALAEKTGKRRFSVALGLRALTLQTGREYRRELDLNDELLAIAVGGSAVKQLFENAQNENKPETDTGSESQDDYLERDLYVDYKGELYQHSLSIWTNEKKNQRIEKLIQAPVLVCTIDHLMPATEGTRGGRQIGPMLRLLTSDLVIDEPDDFGLSDLPALCRLIHWAGMLGSRVLLSTATMPPALAYAAFQAYHDGWSQFAKANVDNWNNEITCAWFDENKTDYKSISIFSDYQKTHEKFVATRIKYLIENTNPKHLAEILPISKKSDETVELTVASTLQQGALTLHQQHYQLIADKKVSIGLVRMANINPLVAVAKELLKLELNQPSTRIHLCVYHSRFPLAIRSHIENKLDLFLKRNPKNEVWPPKEFVDDLNRYDEDNHIFIVLASPVAEVGRDHDYDWAIIEPSSMRSIIQIAGRVLRHRNRVPEHSNILLMDKNIKSLNGKDRCFDRPGFELAELELKMDHHDLNTVLDDDQYQKLNASQRVTVDKDYKKKAKVNLVALEHYALQQQLFGSKNAAKIWWQQQPYWCGEVQKQQRFRDSKKDIAIYLFLNNGEIDWQWKNEDVYPAQFGVISGSGVSMKNIENFPIADNKNFWLELDVVTVYLNLEKELRMDLEQIAKRFGEVRIVEYQSNNSQEYSYHACLGLYSEIKEGL